MIAARLTNRHHAIQGSLRPDLFIVGHDDTIDHMPFGEIFHGPTKMRRVDTKHRGTLTDGGRQKKDPLIRLKPLEPIDKIQLSSDRPYRVGRRGTDRLDNELSRTDEIRFIHYVLVALRMYNDLHVRVLLSEIIDVRRLKHLMHAAVAFPQNEPRALDRLDRIAALRHERVPHDHILTRDAHFVRGIASQMFVGKK